jgi:5,10-methylenetetrahydromethanopterin reductase
MEFGIVLFPSPDCWRVVARAEKLGFSHAWFYDTQMLASDVFACMALAAEHTSRIKLGTGVLVPTNRIAPVTAAAFGTLNELAPGRIIFGVGTGFTARNVMGQRPQPLDDMAEHIRVVRALMRGDSARWRGEGEEHLLRFVHPGRGFVNQRDPVPVHISAFGPRGKELTVREGDGWITFFGAQDAVVAEGKAMADLARAAGRDPAQLYRTAFTLGCVLEEGEPYDSPRAVAQAGPLSAVRWHGAMERWPRLSGSTRAELARQRALYESYEPADARYIALHTGHLMFVRDDERPFVTAEEIRRGTFTGTAGELRERVVAIEQAGYHQLAVQLVNGHEDAIEDWARLFGL